MTLRRAVRVALIVVLVAPALPAAAGVEVLFDLSSPATSPFPSDRFTVDDHRHLTGIRVDLPRPDCAVRPSDCADIDVINTLDGFNLQPRLSIPFSGPIDPSTVDSDSIFLVRLNDTTGRHDDRGDGDGHDGHDGDGHRRGHGRDVVGINQIVWDPATNVLHAEADELLDQHTRYALIVTSAVRDTAGRRVEAGDFGRFRRDLDFGQSRDRDLKEYRKALLDAVAASDRNPNAVVGASVFTTQSATAVLEKIRDRIKSTTPAAATMLATFPRSGVTAIQWRRQIRTGTDPTSFVTSFLPVPALDVFPGAVGTIAFGAFASPDWETAGKVIPPIGTRSGVPQVQAVNTLYFDLLLPAGPVPPGGWPVVIFGHGFTDSKHGAPIAVASTLASQGLASIAINVVGHGGGAAGTLTIIPAVGAPVTIPDGGRGIDQDGNGTIDSTEGVNAAPPAGIVGSRDGLRQTVADLVQLVRVIGAGGVPGVHRSRIYYAGQSFGGIYGVKLIAVEPSIRAGVPNVPGGAIIEIARLSPAFRALVGFSLLTRVPSLSNAGPFAPPLWGFNENIPLRDQPTVINAVPGAMPIQEVLDNTEWVSQAGNPVAYAPHLRRDPLDDVRVRPFVIQSAKGDQTVPNPTASAIARAGDLFDRLTLFRNDLVRLARPTAPANPHTFLTNIGNPAVADLAIAGQLQIAVFLASDGDTVIDPDGLGPFFEVPIADDQITLMEGLNF